MFANYTAVTATYLCWLKPPVTGALRARIALGGLATHRLDPHDPKRLTQVAHCLKDFLDPLQRFPQL